MRTTLLAVGLLVAFQSPLHAQEADARAILDKALKAQGDEKVAQKLMTNTAKAKGTIRAMDMPFNLNLQIWTQVPNKYKVAIDMAAEGFKLEIIQVINGDRGWVSFDGNVADIDDEGMKEAKDAIYVEKLTNLFTIKSDSAMQLAPLGDSKFGDKAMAGIKVSKKGHHDVKLFFDKATNLLARAEYRARDPISKEEVNQEKLFDNYKEMVPGFKMPTKITVKNDGQLFLDFDITEVRPVDRHDDSVFGIPK